jgi:hypothetical protein
MPDSFFIRLAHEAERLNPHREGYGVAATLAALHCGEKGVRGDERRREVFWCAVRWTRLKGLGFGDVSLDDITAAVLDSDAARGTALRRRIGAAWSEVFGDGGESGAAANAA